MPRPCVEATMSPLPRFLSRPNTATCGRPLSRKTQLAPPSLLWKTPMSVPTKIELPFSAMQLVGMSGRLPLMSVQVALPDSPFVVLKTWPGWPGELALKPENVTNAVLPAASEESTSISETKRPGSPDEMGEMFVQVVPTPLGTTLDETEIS